MPLHISPADAELPDIDDRLVAPDTRYEMLDGELVYVSPANKPHGTRHAQIIAVIEAHIGADLDVAADMLTRTSRRDDVAPDVSVFPIARDLSTELSQLPELAFEIVGTQTLGNAALNAATLAERGVRRVFAIDLDRSRAFEWSPALAGWRILESNGQIADPAFEVPLPIESLIHAARTDDAVARALLAKANPVLEAVRYQEREVGKAEGLVQGKAEGLVQGKAEGLVQGKAEGLVQGKAEGLVQALLMMLAARGVAIDDAVRARILGEPDHARLERWIARSTTCASIDELLADG